MKQLEFLPALNSNRPVVKPSRADIGLAKAMRKASTTRSSSKGSGKVGPGSCSADKAMPSAESGHCGVGVGVC